jgi:hypothetical protein
MKKVLYRDLRVGDVFTHIEEGQFSDILVKDIWTNPHNFITYVECVRPYVYIIEGEFSSGIEEIRLSYTKDCENWVYYKGTTELYRNDQKTFN